MVDAFARFASRRAHLETGNLLRSLTEVINKVPGGINLGQGVCDLDSPIPLQAGAIDLNFCRYGCQSSDIGIAYAADMAIGLR